MFPSLETVAFAFHVFVTWCGTRKFRPETCDHMAAPFLSLGAYDHLSNKSIAHPAAGRIQLVGNGALRTRTSG